MKPASSICTAWHARGIRRCIPPATEFNTACPGGAAGAARTSSPLPSGSTTTCSATSAIGSGARAGRSRRRPTGWAQGPPVDYVRDLCRYWADDYDWRATEARLNRRPQFRTEIDGLGIHFVHVRSPRADAVPLVMTHGWPGSIVEFEKVIEPLSRDFHLVLPSLPGYGFSDKPARAGWTVEHVADAWAELMGRLGYERFVAQGHDWGTSVSTELGKRHPARVIGLHLVPPLAPPDPDTFDDLTDAERSALDDLERRIVGRRLFAGAVDPTADHRVRPGRLAGRAVRLGHREVPVLDRLRRRPGERAVPRRTAGQPDVLLAARHRRSAARLYWESFAQVQERFVHRDDRLGGRADRLFHLPEGESPAIPALGRDAVPGHPLLERAGQGRSLRGLRAAGPVRRGGPSLRERVRRAADDTRPRQSPRRSPRPPPPALHRRPGAQPSISSPAPFTPSICRHNGARGSPPPARPAAHQHPGPRLGRLAAAVGETRDVGGGHLLRHHHAPGVEDQPSICGLSSAAIQA